MWEEGNPEIISATALHQQKRLLYVAFRAGGIISTFFLERASERTVIIHGEPYKPQVIVIFHIMELTLTQHIKSIKLLQGRLISLNDGKNWRLRSSDLTL